jgi:protein-L-isoaspartate O-methyltransferase
VNAEGLNAAMVDDLAARGDLTDPAWRAALLAVPRHLFVPPVAWCSPYDADDYPIDREADPGLWLRSAYRNMPIVTQLDDGAVPVASGQGEATSSLSAPDIVMRFLELLGPRPGDRVLEIGTGQGWTAGLLCHRVGARNVTSVELDGAVHARAAGNLRDAGREPLLILGDGGEGWPGGAPYDRVHVAAGVLRVPYPWVAQTRPGGVIVLPWMPYFQPGHQLRLTVGADGVADGRFHGGAGYMPLRGQRSPAPPTSGTDFRSRAGDVEPRTLTHAGYGADVAIAGMLPDVVVSVREGSSPTWLWTEDGASAARAVGSEVEQFGPRSLWDEMEDAFHRWEGWGRPGRDRFGMRVGPDGQYVWLDSPDNPVR